MNEWKGIKDFTAGLMPEADFDNYISANAGVLYEGMVMLMASDALLPNDASAAFSTDIESANGPRIRLVQYPRPAGAGVFAAHWTVRSWFASSNISYIDVFGFADSSSDVGVQLGTSTISDGDDLTAISFNYDTNFITSQAFSAAYDYKKTRFTPPATDAFDGVVPGDVFSISVERRGAATGPTNYYVSHIAIG
jgi:hypothetical protein